MTAGPHERLEAPGLDLRTYVGSNLAVRQGSFRAVHPTFRKFGFDRAFDSEMRWTLARWSRIGDG